MTAIKTFNVSFPVELADELDRKASENFGSRSDLLRFAVLKYLREEQELEGIFSYGKKLGEKIGYQSEETVARALTAKRRATETWRVQA